MSRFYGDSTRIGVLLFESNLLAIRWAQVAELVDAHVSGACVERHAGSSPVLGTKYLIWSIYCFLRMI